jgi:hypothetical protein
VSDDIEKQKKDETQAVLNRLLAAVDANPLYPDAASREDAKRAIREGFAAES